MRKKALQEKKLLAKGTVPRGTLKGTLRKAISPWKQGTEEEVVASSTAKFDLEEELSAVKSTVMTNWRKLQGTLTEDVQVEYMKLVKNWHGFGSTMFYVTTKDPGLPSEVVIGISVHNVSIYKREDSRPLFAYSYEDITQFGAPSPNTYRIVVEGRSPIIFQTEHVVEIAKLMKAYINEIVKNAKRLSMAERERGVVSDDSLYTSSDTSFSPPPT